jgi:signal transduction histidine kinase
MGPTSLLLWPAGVALGLGAEAVGFGWGDARHWIPDLAVGWGFIGLGLVAMRRRPASISAALLAATGFAWFLGNFAAAGVGWVAWLGAHLLFLYRGPLIHLVLTYPSGRTRSRLTMSAIAAGYAVSLVTGIWQNTTLALILAALLVGVAARDHLRAVGRSRRAHLPALQAATALGLALGIEAAIRLALPTSTGNEALLLAYEAVLIAIAGGLGLGLLYAPWERVEITDVVVELGEERSGTLRAELSRALGDPSLDIGYWLPDREVFVDAEGRTVLLPEADSGRSVTMVERDGERIAALVHDPAVLEDPGLVEAVSVAARLAASNAQLQAEVRARLAELVASRRRIVEAADEERRRLAGRLHQGAERRLAELARRLSGARQSAVAATTKERIEQAESQIAQTLEELGELAQGLHPHVLVESGLEGALDAVVRRVPVPVELSVDAGGLPPPVEAAVYFVCSEAIANVVKYASASRARVSVTADDGRVSLTVQDDGIGGAKLDAGSGLRGLADRVEALGGTLGIDSPPGEGTHLTAEIPIQPEADAPRSWAIESGSPSG